MARYYEMAVTVNGNVASRSKAILEAMREHWSFERGDCWVHSAGDMLGSTGRSNLCGGESEEDFARRLTRAIWSANGAYCTVEVRATCLEQLPYKSYQLDEREYLKLQPDEGEEGPCSSQ